MAHNVGEGADPYATIVVGDLDRDFMARAITVRRQANPMGEAHPDYRNSLSYPVDHEVLRVQDLLAEQCSQADQKIGALAMHDGRDVGYAYMFGRRPNTSEPKGVVWLGSVCVDRTGLGRGLVVALTDTSLGILSAEMPDARVIDPNGVIRPLLIGALDDPKSEGPLLLPNNTDRLTARTLSSAIQATRPETAVTFNVVKNVDI